MNALKMNSANSRADWIKRSGWAQREPSPPSPQETDFNWDFSTPLPRISRGSSPIPMPINPDPRPDETHEPSPVVSEPDIPIHHFHHQYYFEDAKDEFIVSGKTMLTMQCLTFHTGRRVSLSNLSFPL